MFPKAATILLIGAIFQAMYIYASIEGPKKVTATLYYESLCPYCHVFIEKQLVPTFNIMSDYIKVELVPYGNTQRRFVDGHWRFICQHGKAECAENLVDACAVLMLQNHEPSKLLKFISCMPKHNETLFKRTVLCTKEAKIRLGPLESCVLSPDNVQLMLRMAEKTESVRPNITGVPTVQIDGVYDPNEADEIYNDFKKVVCKHLGDPQPKICNEV